MSRAYAVASPAAGALAGAVGGALAGLGAGIALVVGAMVVGHRPVAALNMAGAWTVRWLQSAAPDAFEHFYWDATLLGAITLLTLGAAAGALFALVLARLPNDHPVAWGVFFGVGAWVAVRWALGPALDPVLVRKLDWRVLLPTCLIYGVLLGAWIDATRAVSASMLRRAEPA